MFLDHPSITATDSQSEPERIERLNRVYGYALALADGAEGAGSAALTDRLNQLHDHKGTLIVFWNKAPGEPERAIFARARASKAGAGTTCVEHES
ncbi:MAG: hypothetical protein JWP72_3115 [Massilia sp.]|nr:hypothetical protein [Massilia sp.]